MHFDSQDDADFIDADWLVYPDGRLLCAVCRWSKPCLEHLWDAGECIICGEEHEGDA